MSNNANNANTTSNVATQWKLLMTGMILILIFGLILCVNFLRQQHQNANNGMNPTNNTNLSNDLLHSLLSPISHPSTLESPNPICKDRDWPFSTQSKGLRTLHENSSIFASNRVPLIRKELPR